MVQMLSGEMWTKAVATKFWLEEGAWAKRGSKWKERRMPPAVVVEIFKKLRRVTSGAVDMAVFL
jgi:hypothetical protein